MTERLVTCHSGYTYAERPLTVLWEGEQRLIDQILSRERFPDGWRFRISTQDGLVLVLLYLEDQDLWQVHQT